MNKSIATNDEIIPSNFSSEVVLPKLVDVNHPRHIFIFLDGTWNEERSSHGQATPTNVLRMYQEINHKTSQELSSSNQGDFPNIVAHYYRGVGSRQDNSTLNRMWHGFSGKDEERIRSAAFADLYRNYKNKNDCIYIIGFSRGAASARLLARDIGIKGLPPRLRIHTANFPNLLTGQIEARVDSVERLDEVKNSDNYTPEIAFLGCWDTVDAFVLPSRFPNQNLIDKYIRILKSPLPRLFGKERFKEDESKIPDKVNKAVHCVAIDETRNAFLPTLMPYEKKIEEVWFPGVHSDVGGGYGDNRLARGPYEFMKNRLAEATKFSVNVLFKTREYNSHSSEYCFHYHGLNTGMKKIKGVFGFGTYIRKIRVLNIKGTNSVKPKIHASLNNILTSDCVFAANPENKRVWTITYDPYNVRQLKQEFDIISDQTNHVTSKLGVKNN